MTSDLSPSSQPQPATRAELLEATDQWLAAVIGKSETRWKPFPAYPDWDALVAERIVFHGIAGLIAERRTVLEGWPDGVMHVVRDLSVEHAMWEMLHKLTLTEALGALSDAGVSPVILKGTALAYTLYERPVQRFRSDTDVLVDAGQREAAGKVLTGLGFERVSANHEMTEDLEELWVVAAPDGSQHKIDLHWQAIDAPALEELLPYEACIEGASPLVGLSEKALRMDLPTMLLHAIAHRAKHRVSPYFAGGKKYHDADRLIWLYDFDLLARALDESDWQRFCELAWRFEIAPVCVEGLGSAARLLGTPLPASILARLQDAPESPASAYLGQDRQLARSWKNFRALPGPGRKAAFLRSKLLPSAAFMRGKYPQLARWPLPALYVWRIAELFVKRPRARER